MKRFFLHFCLIFNLFFNFPICAQETEEAKHKLSSDEMYAEAVRMLNEHRYVEAQNILIKVIEQVPNHAGAWLDLAIIQCELGNEKQANYLFEQLAVRFSPPIAILEVINKQKIENCSTTNKSNQYLMSLLRGYDSNINQGTSNSTYILGSESSQIELQLLPEYLPKKDHFSMATLSASTQNTAYDVTAFLQFNVRKYDYYSAFNTLSLATGINKVWNHEQWSSQLSFTGAYILLDNSVYQKQASAYLMTMPTYQSEDVFKYNFSAGVNFINYPTLLNFGSNIYEVRTQLVGDFKPFQIITSFAAMYDHAHLERPGGNRKGFFTSVSLRKKIAPKIESELSWNHQFWLSSSSYSPGLINEIRRQNNDSVKVGLKYLINKNQSISLDLNAFNNMENISFLEYKNKSIYFSWNWKN